MKREITTLTLKARSRHAGCLVRIYDDTRDGEVAVQAVPVHEDGTLCEMREDRIVLSDEADLHAYEAISGSGMFEPDGHGRVFVVCRLSCPTKGQLDT